MRCAALTKRHPILKHSLLQQLYVAEMSERLRQMQREVAASNNEVGCFDSIAVGLRLITYVR